jgi:beta-lactamase regulating signal transducer with metallopeptidase domain
MTDWLLGTLLATSALIVLVLLIREPVRRHFGARVAYGLWLIPAARLLMPTLTRTVERPLSAANPIRPFVPSVLAEPKFLASVAPVQPSLVDQLGGWPLILVTLWLGVALALFLRGMLAFRRERSAILAASVDIAHIGSIRLVRSPLVNGPLAFGILDRVIAVPADFDRRFGDGERRLALDHELSHHHSGDLIANHFAFVLLCLQWFNPLAWVAHAAFRFDQEAACDARVLDKANADDRADYGRAIAKAASGRALLFASALDRHHSLKRRLSSMLTNPTSGRRLAGRAMVLVTVAAAMPLTATGAVNYVDVPVPAALAPVTPVATPIAVASVLPVAATASVASVQAIQAAQPSNAVAASKPDISFIGKDTVHINGQTKRWDELTPAERAEIRARTDEARRDIEKHLARLPEELAQARRDTERFRNGDFQREMAEAREGMQKALADIDQQAAVLRATGQDPERIKAEIRASLSEVEKMDIDKIVRESLASVDPDKIRREVESAARSLDEIQAKLDQLDRR